jgi:prepilin-type N-terminal cleavage/methylation domain-containing protein
MKKFISTTKTMKTSKTAAFTLIELLVVISIIAILAGIALPVFGEVQTRGAQTKALSNAKQVGTACKLYAMDYQGNFPAYTKKTDGSIDTAGVPTDSNQVLETLIPDYLPDKGVFSIPKSAYCKVKPGASNDSTTQQKLQAGENEWAYVTLLSDTSNSRFPLLADGFAQGTETAPNYIADETKPGGVWKGKKAIVVRVDISGTVETCYRSGSGPSAKYTVKRSDADPTKNAFVPDSTADPAWMSDSNKVLNPTQPQN